MSFVSVTVLAPRRAERSKVLPLSRARAQSKFMAVVKGKVARRRHVALGELRRNRMLWRLRDQD